MKTTKEFLEVYKNWKEKRDKEIAEKIAKQDPLIRKENGCISKQDFYNKIMDNSNKAWANDYRTGNYFDVRAF